MADFENGLPSVNTDMTDKKVSDVVIQKDEPKSSSQQTVQAVNVLADEATILTQASIDSVRIVTKQAGRNTLIFYL